MITIVILAFFVLWTFVVGRKIPMDDDFKLNLVVLAIVTVAISPVKWYAYILVYVELWWVLWILSDIFYNAKFIKNWTKVSEDRLGGQLTHLLAEWLKTKNVIAVSITAKILTGFVIVVLLLEYVIL